MFLYWANVFDFLLPWAGKCRVNWFPGDNPDAAMVDKAGYEERAAKRCDRVWRYLSGGNCVTRQDRVPRLLYRVCVVCIKGLRKCLGCFASLNSPYDVQY